VYARRFELFVPGGQLGPFVPLEHGDEMPLPPDEGRGTWSGIFGDGAEPTLRHTSDGRVEVRAPVEQDLLVLDGGVEHTISASDGFVAVSMGSSIRPATGDLSYLWLQLRSVVVPVVVDGGDVPAEEDVAGGMAADDDAASIDYGE